MLSAPSPGINFARRRNGFPRLQERLRDGDEVRIVAFGGSLTRDIAYLAPLVPRLDKVYPSASVEIARRALPGFSAASAAFRTQSVVDLKPDLAIIEFAIHDLLLPPQAISRAIEGIVRKIRASDPERDIAFVYFGEVGAVQSGQMKKIVEVWERIADHYAIPSFDCIGLASWLVENGKAVWFERWPGRRSWSAQDRTVVLTHEGALHTSEGGAFLGGYIAEALLAMLAVPSHISRDLPLPLDPLHWGDASWVAPSALGCDGWVAGTLPEQLQRRWCSAYFDECVAALAPGARMSIRFVGRCATLWTLQATGILTATLDGRPIPLDLSGAYDYRWHNLINSEENRPHLIEITAEGVPAIVAGIDLLGRFQSVKAF